MKKKKKKTRIKIQKAFKKNEYLREVVSFN
jgi:hypothetical protein